MASVRTAMSFLSVVLWIILAFTVETKAQNSTEREWWKDTIVYQIWTRSFQDSDSDGIGDLQGVKSRLYHFVDLGVETIWLNTIYPSPLSNSGYDVTDYKNIDSTYGDLDDFYELITAAHDLGLKVILDFIPNHSSINHTWFNASIYRTHPYTDYYIWDNGTTNASGYNIPPNNWESTLSDDGEGSAWSWNEIRQQWYLHQFTANEADFNLRNDAVIEELLDILDFWLDKGVDGFYINGVPYLFEDEDLTDNPIGSLIYTFGLADNVGLLSKFRERIDTWVLRNDNITKFVVAEGFENVENLMAYYGNDTNKGIAPVNIEFIQILTSTSNASYIKSTIDEWISALPSNQTSNWKLSNQDYSRISSRYGLNRADGLNMFILSLPGRVFTYYGEEIALLDNNEITYAETIDSLACAAGEDSYTTVTRDPYRTPMQWDTTSNAGFTESSSAYLPVHTSYLTRNVESQIASTISNIQTYKAVAALRSNPTFIYGSCEIQTLNNDKVLILRRSLDDNPTYIVVINLALSKQTINVTEIFSDVSTNLTIAVRSANAVFSDTTVTSDGFILTANAAVILTDGVDDEPTRPEVTTAELDWWQTAVIYQIYPKSFQDSDGDGIGDLQGIISRLDYLEDTGFTGFSLTPIYPSPQIDGGYDVSNFTGIDPIFGQFEDFQELVNTAHQKNLKVILDFVPNHSSNEHIWFQNSVARVEPYTDYYVWKDGVSSGNVVQPPNNWLSVFGGSAWTWNEQRQQYYLHQFHESQPDLNLRNSAVVTEITDVLRFWLDQDVDGFRISSVAHLFEDASFLDEPLNEEASSGVTETDYEYLRHIYTTDLDETIDIIYQWRAVVDEYSTRPDSETKILVTDSTARQNVITRYFGNQTHEGAHIPLNFGFISNLRRESTAYDFVEMAEEWFSALPHGRTSNSIFGNHDVSRIASRFFLNRVDSLNMQLLLSPGTAFTYQGEELGLLDTLISYEETEDPGAIAAGPNRFELFTRDPARTPFHWDGSTSAGFSLNSSTWLPVNPNYLVRNVAIQSAATRSMYQTYKALLDIRQSETIKRGSITFKSANDGMVLAIVRELEGYESYAILANFGVHFANVNLTALTNFPTENVTICLASANSLVETGTTINVNSVVLTASAAVVLCNKVADVTEPETTTPITDTEAVILDDWFTTASIYQIYPKSFQDSNDDGVGDLQGIISRLDHLRETGITAIWLNSIATSPQIDGGYDITNFTDIDPIFGNLEDFAELVRQAHARELKIIIDFVPNHSSNEHVWFQNSIARIEPYTDYYIWKDGIVSDNRLQPPNNWLSVFGGSAWTWSEQRQQYYLHQFHTSQPDLNFRNPDVVTEMTNVLKFWLDQEVDGFRICSVAHLFEDEDFFDEPRNANPDPYILETDYDYLEHIYTTDRDETVDIVYQWRTVVDEHAEQSDGQARILITDSSANQNVVSRYFGNQTHQGAHVPLNFAMITNLTRLSSASSYINAFNEWFAILPENRTSNWILGNHDNTRIASKFGLNRADGLNMLLLLRGTTFTYMGEELALLDTEVSFNDTQDPHAINAGPDRFQLFTRDPARTPYQWDNTSLAGFSTSNSSWLPVNDNYVFRNLAVQKTAERSNYHTYQAILQLRQRECIKYGTTQFLSLNSDMVLAFTREILSGERYAVIINLGLGQLIVDLSNLETFVNEDVYVFLASANSVINTGSTVNISAVPLSANAALVLSTRQIEDTTQQLSTLDTITTPSITSTETVTETATSTPIFPTIPDRPILVSGEITGNLDWWQEAAVYQIYPKSFQDSNGDGVGDLQGIISRLEHLSDTGVTAIWLNSLLASPQVDGGFDISNFTAVDTIFGTLDDFAELIQEAHNKEIRVIIDFVPNHSSNEHVWFQNSVARIEPYTDYYVWRDGITLDNGIQPPNNWLSVFGGSAWSWNEQRQQYYLHQFDTSQADLNFRNPAVVSEITNVLRFWLDQGVDGFRVSSVAHIFEDVHFPDEPLNESPGPNVLETDYEYLQHIYTTDLDETIDIVYQWRTLLDEYTAQLDVQTRVLVTDSAASQDVVARYFGNQTHQGAHLPLNFGLIAKLGQPSLASDYIQVLTSWFATLPENGTSNWILGNHDERRPASRFGTNRVDGLNMLHLLPGTAFTYMGEELALLDTEISFADTQDPYAINAGPDRYSLFTRDPARTPYHWDNSTSGGFSTNESTWLPMNSNYVTRNLIAQIAAERSNFNTYKSILKLKQSQTIKRGATHIWALNNNSVLVFTRQLQDEPVYAVAINLGLVTVSVNFSQFSGLPSEGMRVCLASANAVISTGTIVNIMSVSLSANAAVVLCNSEVPETTTVSITTTTVADMPSTTVELSTETPTTSPTPVHTESEPPTTIPPLITTPSTSTTTTFSTTMNAFSTTLIPSTETSATSTTLIISTTANTTTVPSTTVESSTKTPTILPTMATDKPEPETEPDYSEENTTEDSASAAVTTYISSLLIIVPIWNISL